MSTVSTVWTPEQYLQRMRSTAVYNVAQRTPLNHAEALSKRFHNKIWIKREDLQPVHSFKLRGAYSAMSRLSSEQLEQGVIAASAGNHAQGVALAAKHLGCKSTIVVPKTTPTLKQNAIKGFGAELILAGDSYDDAYAFAVKESKVRRLTFVHPYDDREVIAGQGTIGLELHEQLPPETTHVFVAVGGGGLISGVALALKQLRPTIKIIGVEPEDSNAMTLSIKIGERVQLDKVGLFADGVAVKHVGAETFRICREWVDDWITVSNDQICAAIKDIFEDQRAVLEPAGALSLAGMKTYLHKHRLTDQTVAMIACGANINFDRLRHIAERAALGENSEAIFAIKIPEKPGSFLELCQLLGNRSITEFNYRMQNPSEATVFAGIQTKDPFEAMEIWSLLKSSGFESWDLSENELAKTHVRHMIGGPSIHAENERIFHFDFPERPGALLEFLSSMSGGWNISLFHYRNHGSDIGRVLVGIQVPPSLEERFQKFLGSLGFPYTEVSKDASIRLFL
jgi:threonine dehydratase